MQIALGDLADPPSFRNALRGVRHRRAPRRRRSATSRGGSIEELNGIATLAHGARPPSARASSASCSSRRSARRRHNRARFLRAKALAEQAVARVAGLAIDRRSRRRSSTRRATAWLTLLERLALLPVDARLSGRGRPRYQPIWAEDVADCARGALLRGAATRRRRRAARATSSRARRRSPTTRSSATVLARGGPRSARSCTSRPPSSRARCARSRSLLRARAPADLGRGRAASRSAMTSPRGTEDAAPWASARPRRVLGVSLAARRPSSGRGRPALVLASARAGSGAAPVRRMRAPTRGSSPRDASARGAAALGHRRRRSAQGWAASSWAASASSAPSPAGWPTSWTPSGSRARRRPGARRAAARCPGEPVTLPMAVYGRELAGAGEVLERRRRSAGRSCPAARGRLRQRRRQHRVELGRPLHDARGRRPASAARPARPEVESIVLQSWNSAQLSGSMSSAVGSRPASIAGEGDLRADRGAEARRERPQQRRVAPRRLDLDDLVAERAQQLGGVLGGLDRAGVDRRVERATSS